MNASATTPAKVATALFILLVITVGAAYVNLGPLGTPVAMLISSLKAGLIILFFMHIQHATPLIKLVVLAGFFWLGIMLALTFSDYFSRNITP